MSQEEHQIALNEALEGRRVDAELRTKYLKRTDPFLVVCRLFSVISILSALLCVVVNVLSAIQSFKNGEDVFDGILRCYAVLIALFVVVAETEWERIQKFWRILEFWVGRGMLQIFVAVMTRALSEATSEKTYIILLREIASYMLLSCGVIYIIAGLLCCGRLKRSRLSKVVSREQAAKDLEELERRREELRSLLLERDQD